LAVPHGLPMSSEASEAEDKNSGNISLSGKTEFCFQPCFFPATVYLFSSALDACNK